LELLALKYSKLSINEDLGVPFSLNDLEKWQEANVRIRELIIVDVLFSRAKFIGYYRKHVLVLQRSHVFYRSIKSDLTQRSEGNLGVLNVKTYLPGAIWLNFMYFILLASVCLITILPKWVKSELGGEAFQLFDKAHSIPILILVLALVLQRFILSYTVRRVHYDLIRA